jgi:hypothetical protein
MSELIDNRAHRIQVLKDIITRLHRGVDPEAVRAELTGLVREVDSTEIAAMEQELMADGMAVEEVQSMCDLHSQVLRDVVTEPPAAPVPFGHPIDTFRCENRALRRVVDRMRRDLAGLERTADPEAARLALLRGAGELADVDKHYLRKENLLFPLLERHGVTGPSKVMWGKDDEVRGLLRDLEQALSAPLDADELALVGATVVPAALDAVAEMIHKEERILLPMAASTLSEEEWGEVWTQSPEYGWCLVDPGVDYRPPVAAASVARPVPADGSNAIDFATGRLTVEQITGLFSRLPVDLTFVDADDRVRYFSSGPERIFARSKAVLGRKVQHCHPPKSVHLVEQILSDFRAGRQSVAEFWIQLGGKFVHIRYFAVRGEAGEYLGTLEVTQDLAPLRALTGERRILAYGDAPARAEVEA